MSFELRRFLWKYQQRKNRERFGVRNPRWQKAGSPRRSAWLLLLMVNDLVVITIIMVTTIIITLIMVNLVKDASWPIGSLPATLSFGSDFFGCLATDCAMKRV